MSVKVSTNFELKQRIPLDIRMSYANLDSLKLASDRYTRVGLYDGLIAWVESEQMSFIFNSHFPEDETLGKWRVHSNTIPTIESIDIESL